jgi:hypothetical protein
MPPGNGRESRALTGGPEPPSEEHRKFYFDGGAVDIVAHLVYELDPDGRGSSESCATTDLRCRERAPRCARPLPSCRYSGRVPQAVISLCEDSCRKSLKRARQQLSKLPRWRRRMSGPSGRGCDCAGTERSGGWRAGHARGDSCPGAVGCRTSPRTWAQLGPLPVETWAKRVV